MIYVAQKAHKNITHLCKAPIQGALEIRKRNNLQMGYHPFGGPGRHQTCTSSLTINFQPDCQFISPLYPFNQLAWKYIQSVDIFPGPLNIFWGSFSFSLTNEGCYRPLRLRGFWCSFRNVSPCLFHLFPTTHQFEKAGPYVTLSSN